MEAIEDEVHKLIACDFTREEQHPDWVANIVPILKKNEKKFGSVLITATSIQLVLKTNSHCHHRCHNTCRFERMSFMDGFSGYNQIKMYLEDEKHISFRTPLEVYCYTVMPFRLKNAGATY